jgi:hypothetical protein
MSGFVSIELGDSLSNEIMALVCPLNAPATDVLGNPTICGQFNASQFPNPPSITPVLAPSGPALVLAPASSDAAQSMINDLISGSVAQSQGNEQTFFNNLPLATNPLDLTSWPWYVWAVVIGGVVVLIKVLQGRL